MSPTSYQTAPSRNNITANTLLNWYSAWCGRGDLNPHARRHYHLKVACLPIPPPPQLCGTHSSPSHTKRKGLIDLILWFLAHLMKFQAALQVATLYFVQISSYKHLSFASWQTPPRSNWLQKISQ